MYRYISPDQRSSIFAIRDQIKAEHPNDFTPIRRVRPHVGILPLKTAMTYVGNPSSDQSNRDTSAITAARLLTSIYYDMPVSSLRTMSATCTSVDRIGMGVGVILASAEVSNEIEFAWRAFGMAVGKRLPTARHPYFLVGYSAGSRISDQVLTTTSEACGIFLPDGKVGLDPVSLQRPGRGK